MPRRIKKAESDKPAQDYDLSELIKRKIQENNAIKKLMEYLNRENEEPAGEPEGFNPDVKDKRRSSP